jgi:GntR family transcriptional repressor for pyruvate dehydrogenase complex
MMITPARRKNLYEEISNQIISMISEGRWKQGEKIPGEIELAGMFEVSRNSVRESIKALELVGLLNSKSGRGTFVSDQAVFRIKQLHYTSDLENEDVLKEIMEARLIIEPGLAAMAAEKASPEDVRLLEASVDACLSALENKTYSFELGLAFHSHIFRISGNRILNNLFENMKETLIVTRRKIFFKHIKETVLIEELNEHRAIINFIKNKKAEQARNAMKKHIAISLERLEKSKPKKT